MTDSTSLVPRAAIRAMPAYKPPQEGRRGLRLDFNENTEGCSPRVIEALRQTSAQALAEDLARYPEYDAAEAEIAAFFGHTPATALVTNGVDDAILLAVTTYLDPGSEAIIVTPTFAMYRFYCQQAGVVPVEVAYQEYEVETGVREFRLSIEAVLAAVTARTRAIFIATPNNPTGNHTPETQILALARLLPECLIFADEAYADFVDPAAASSAGYEGLLPAVEETPNLLVARTFSKAYGLAGARLGCLFAHPGALPWLRKAHSPYNVNTLALRCGRAALADAAWAQAYCIEAVASRAVVEATLTELGITYWKSQANFVLFDSGDRTTALIAGLRARGVLIRDRRGDWPGAARISCGRLETTRRACAAFTEVWREL
ncbi:MAG TPA: histidinol-phosphate transaminase [Terriglobales bacterium]|jgi:histidinol-phosphate aminotransferase